MLTDPGHPTSQTCRNSTHVVYLVKARAWKCYARHSAPKFTLKTGTIFEDSPLGLDKWLAALWLLVNAKNGISSCEIARSIGITQKSAWFMAHRLRFALHHGSFDKLTGEVEADETFMGGKVRTIVVENRRKKASQAEVHAHVEAGSALYTDALLSYEGLDGKYAHQVSDHAVK